MFLSLVQKDQMLSMCWLESSHCLHSWPSYFLASQHHKCNVNRRFDTLLLNIFGSSYNYSRMDVVSNIHQKYSLIMFSKYDPLANAIIERFTVAVSIQTSLFSLQVATHRCLTLIVLNLEGQIKGVFDNQKKCLKHNYKHFKF